MSSPAIVNTSPKSESGKPSYVPPLSSFYGGQTTINASPILLPAATTILAQQPLITHQQPLIAVQQVQQPVMMQQVHEVQQVTTTRPKYNWTSQYVMVQKRVQTPKVIKEQVTVMVPKEVVETIMVPKETMEAVQVTKTIMVPKTVMENQTIMVPKVIEADREIRIPHRIMEKRKVVVPRQRVVMYEEEQVIEVPATEEYTQHVSVPTMYQQQYTTLRNPIGVSGPTVYAGNPQFLNSMPINGIPSQGVAFNQPGVYNQVGATYPVEAQPGGLGTGASVQV